MNFRELCKFEVWRFAATIFGEKFYEMSILCRVLTVLGTAMTMIGVAVFVTAPQWGKSSYDYTVKLDAPQPILSDSRLLAANGRVYVFVEEMCAVNVYGESGKFEFCVRGPRCQNGKAQMFLSGTEIYIFSRDHTLYRFDENGTYSGKVDRFSLYDSHDQPVTPLYVPQGGEHIQPAYFDDSGVWYYSWYDDVGSVLFFSDGKTVETIGPMQRSKMEGCVYAEKRYAASDGGAVYTARVNQIYRTTDSGAQVFAATPLYLYYIKSPGLGWLTLVVGKLSEYLAEKLSRRRRAKQHKAV